MKFDAGNSSSIGASFVDIFVLSIAAILILKSFFFSLLFERVRRKEKMKLMIIQGKAPLNSYLRTRDALASQISVVKILRSPFTSRGRWF